LINQSQKLSTTPRDSVCVFIFFGIFRFQRFVDQAGNSLSIKFRYEK